MQHLHPLQQNIRNLNTPMNSVNGRYSRDMSSANLTSHMSPVAGSGGLLVNFFYTRVKTRNRDADHNGKTQTRLCVSKQPRGDRSTVAVGYISEEEAMRNFPEQFSMFKEYGEVMTTGTPLHELPGISMSDIGLLAINGLRSVEDLANLSDDLAAQLGRDATRAHKVAKEWIQRRDGGSELIDAAEANTNHEIERRTLQETIDKQEASIKALEAQVAAMTQATRDQVAAQTAMPNNSAQLESQIAPVGVDNGEDLPYDVADMDDPMSEGPDVALGSEELATQEIDPLS